MSDAGIVGEEKPMLKKFLGRTAIAVAALGFTQASAQADPWGVFYLNDGAGTCGYISCGPGGCGVIDTFPCPREVSDQ
jgi:hypothetical protein